MPSRPKVMSLDPSPQVQRHRHRWAAEGAEEEAHEIRQLAPVPALGAHAVLDSQGPEVDEVPARGYAAAALPGDKHAHQAARLAVFEGPVSDLLGAGLPQRPDDLGARRPRPRHPDGLGDQFIGPPCPLQPGARRDPRMGRRLRPRPVRPGDGQSYGRGHLTAMVSRSVRVATDTTEGAVRKIMGKASNQMKKRRQGIGTSRADLEGQRALAQLARAAKRSPQPRAGTRHPTRRSKPFIPDRGDSLSPVTRVPWTTHRVDAPVTPPVSGWVLTGRRRGPGSRARPSDPARRARLGTQGGRRTPRTASTRRQGGPRGRPGTPRQDRSAPTASGPDQRSPAPLAEAHPTGQSLPVALPSVRSLFRFRSEKARSRLARGRESGGESPSVSSGGSILTSAFRAARPSGSARHARDSCPEGHRRDSFSRSLSLSS